MASPSAKPANDVAWNSRHALLLLLALLMLAGGLLRPDQAELAASAPLADVPRLLSEFALFAGSPMAQQPAAGVIPYDLNSALFSDYTLKYRFIKLPPGQAMAYHAEQTFTFPVGTIIAKTFAMPRDLRLAKDNLSQGQRLLETRILRREPTGWTAWPYIWNKDQTDAELKLGGRTIPIAWTHTDGKERTNSYLVPNANQCKTCHSQNQQKIVPIGPKARHLNRDFAFAHGIENQLAHMTRVGSLQGAPADPHTAPRLVPWDDPASGTVDQRARAWLEINCAHCHSPGGFARNSGLDLLASQTNPTSYGILKPPVAAGRGSGGRRFDIVPGQPEKSILVFRLESTQPDIMMPELGKRLIHDEGLALIRQWIAEMPTP